MISLYFCKFYGNFYNGYTVIDERGICPENWHVPTNNDWKLLSDFIGDMLNGGGKLKEKGYIHWNIPNIGATNQTGFTAMASGGILETTIDGTIKKAFIDTKKRAYFWTSSKKAISLSCCTKEA